MIGAEPIQARRRVLRQAPEEPNRPCRAAGLRHRTVNRALEAKLCLPNARLCAIAVAQRDLCSDRDVNSELVWPCFCRCADRLACLDHRADLNASFDSHEYEAAYELGSPGPLQVSPGCNPSVAAARPAKSRTADARTAIGPATFMELPTRRRMAFTGYRSACWRDAPLVVDRHPTAEAVKE
jgi:hypothetical protein